MTSHATHFMHRPCAVCGREVGMRRHTYWPQRGPRVYAHADCLRTPDGAEKWRLATLEPAERRREEEAAP